MLNTSSNLMGANTIKELGVQKSKSIPRILLDMWHSCVGPIS